MARRDLSGDRAGLCRALAGIGEGRHDIHAGSIVPARDDILWAPYQQFCNFFLFPLYLYAADRDRIARSLLRDYLSGVTDEDLLAALPLSFKLRHPRRTLGVAVPK